MSAYAARPVWMVEPEPARVYGLRVPEHRAIQRRANSIRARVQNYFEAHPAARVTAPELGAYLGLKVENSLAPRLSELVAEGILERTDEIADGPNGVSVHRYAVREKR